MYFRGFHDGATIVLGGRDDFDPVDNTQTYADTLSIEKLKASYKEQMRFDEVKYPFGDYVKDFNLQIYVWLAKNRKKLDLNVQQIQINVGFGGFNTLLR